MGRVFILPYRIGSKSVKSLALRLGAKAIKLENSQFKSRDGDLVVNWGNSSPPQTADFAKCKIVNDPDRVGLVSNKKNFFNLMSGFDVEDKPRIPDWSFRKEEAKGWYDEGHIVFIRTKLTGHSGEGIIILNPEEEKTNWDEVKDNQLFVRYIKKKYEYRVHFMANKIIDIQRKAARRDVENPNFLVRSHANGFVYSRYNVGDVPQDVVDQANKTVKVLGLDFGAIDIIYNKLHNQATVLEVNSAPGLEGTTLDNYEMAFRENFNIAEE